MFSDEKMSHCATESVCISMSNNRLESPEWLKWHHINLQLSPDKAPKQLKT